jgi:glycerophosphoryl diester phosphodiesterase
VIGLKLDPGRSPRRPFVVAHRSGNSLSGLRTAETLGVHAIEADVHLFRGRLEVRHLKTLGPIPILWDRWTLANPFRPRLLVADLLAAYEGASELVLDLKGRNRRLATELLREIEPRLWAGSRITVCARHWPLLEPLRGVEGLRLVHSVGTSRQLRRLCRSGGRIDGVTIDERLLDSRTVRELRELADVILTWPVNTVERAQELVRFGVDGLISDRPGLVQPVVGGPR